MNFTLKVKMDTATPEMRRIQDGLSWMGIMQVNREMADEFMQVTFSAFGANGSNRPIPWKPLSQRYQKRIGYYGPPKLILDGWLSTSINILSETREYCEVGSEVEYADAQQFGDPATNLPARPYFPVYRNGALDLRLTDTAERRMTKRAVLELMKWGLRG